MAEVVFSDNLEEKINKKFKGESVEVFKLLYSLEENPKKGKELGNVAGIVIKEIKYKAFRFYFITDGFKIKVMELEKLKDLMIKVVRMSDKDSQQQTINEIKYTLRKFGEEGF